MAPTPDFAYSDLLPLGADPTPYRKLTSEGVSTFEAGGRRFLQVEPEALRLLTAEAMHDISHYLRPAHLAQLRRILDDPEASPNDRFVALDLLKNVNISVSGILPMCQDTGTAIVMGKRGQNVLTMRPGRGRDRPRRLRRLHQAQPALLADGPADHVGREEHRLQPVGPDRALRDRRRRVQVPLHGQGRRQRQQVVPVPGDQGDSQREEHALLPGAEDPRARHRRLPAVPPGHRGRRHQRRVRAEDRQVRLGALPGRAADQR